MYKLFSFFIFFIILACSRDKYDKPAPVPEETAQTWIERKVREHYYWYQDIPPSEQLDFSIPIPDFFTSLLSDQDGKKQNGIVKHFSWLEEHTDTKAYQGNRTTYGLEFLMYEKMACILYVLPSSPAARAGLKRGEWISAINGSPLTPANASTLYNGGDIQLTIYREKPGNQYVFSRTVEVKAACRVKDNPVFLDTVYSIKNRQFAYLVYNHFTPGPDGPYDETYNNSLRRVFARFAAQQVSELILDLRYNGGGQSSCASLLASMIIPSQYLNQEFCHIVYNDKHPEKNGTIPFKESYIYQGADGANLNLRRVFILTGRQTASSAELVINCLRPYMEVILIGDRTFGKNVAFEEIRNDKLKLTLHLIVAQAFNKNGESDYENGFYPEKDHILIESTQPLKELGDTTECLLHHTLKQITGK